MKITIVTPSFNCEATVLDCVDSVRSQNYRDWEHWIVDGGSTDGTLDVIRDNEHDRLRWVSEIDDGIYDAMNKGIARASGDVIGILNADDLYEGKNVLTAAAECFTDGSVDACFADLVFVDQNDKGRIVRYWKSSPYKKGNFLKGWMLPHPTLFVRKEIYNTFGVFDPKYRIGGDWDLLLRFFEKHRIRSKYVPEIWVRMRSGGASSRDFRSVFANNLENLAAFWRNGLFPRWYYPFYRVFHRVRQLGRKPDE